MQVLNVHSRYIPASKEQLSELLLTLATDEDQFWPQERWPPMRFKEDLKAGVKGGHGPIRYTIEEYRPGEWCKMRFSRPAGFIGHHWLEVMETEEEGMRIQHTIKMHTSFRGSIQWIFAIRALHNALIEDAFDKVENKFTGAGKRTPWNAWVQFLRWMLK